MIMNRVYQDSDLHYILFVGDVTGCPQALQFKIPAFSPN